MDNAEAAFDKEADDFEFYKECDRELIETHGEHARMWLAMLEDPDPDDLIFEYQRIIRRNAYVKGYVRGVFDGGMGPII